MVMSRQTGHALLVAMIILLLVASAVTMVAAHFGFRARLMSQEARRIHLIALTDAAIAESLANLNQSGSYAGVPEREFGGGTIGSEITSLPDSRRQILATAQYRGWRRLAQVRVEIQTAGPVVETWSSLSPARQ